FAARASASGSEPAFFEVAFEGRDVRAVPHSWSAVTSRARRAASALTRAGVQEGDRVVLCLLDPERFLSFFLGAQGLGAIPVPLPGVGDTRSREAFRERVDS